MSLPFPFSAIVGQEEMKLALLIAAVDQSVGGVLVFGDRGTGKSTAIRYAAEHLHPSEYKSLYMTASSGAIMEFYRQLANELNIHIKSNSKTLMLRLIKKEITALVCEKKIKVALCLQSTAISQCLCGSCSQPCGHATLPLGIRSEIR